MTTVFNKKVTVDAEGKEIVFDGCDFKEGGFLVINNASSVTIKNCRFYKLVGEASKNYGIRINGDIDIKLVVENNFFGDNETVDGKQMYNLLELNAKLANGSSISKNYFTKGCCTHNQINVYGAADGAKISINDNYCEYSANLIRLGIKGDPECVIDIRNNTYLNTDRKYYDYAGILLIQPFGSATKTFNNMRVNLDGTINKSTMGQLAYIYAGGSDTKFNIHTNYPKVYIDGELQMDLPAPDTTVGTELPVAE